MNICHKLLDLRSKLKVMADRKVIHLHKNGEDYYFGSLSAIFSVFDKEDIGIGYGALRNYGISPEHSYRNGKVIIKEGVLISAKGERGRKSNEEEIG